MSPDIWRWERRSCWCANVVDPRSGKRLRWYLGPEEGEARRQFHLRMAELLGPDSVPGRDTRGRAQEGSLSLAELAAEYLDWNRDTRSRTTWQFRCTYLRWVVDRFGFEPAAELTPRHVEQVKRAHRRNAPKSVNHFVRAVKGLYNWAVDQGILDENPVARVKGVPRAPVKRRAVSALQAVRACRAADASPPLGDFMRLLLYTGMRSGELAGLPWEAYDAGQRVLVVEAHKTVGQTGEPRILPLSPRAAAVVERQPREGDAIFSDGAGRALSRGALAQRWTRLRPEGCAVTFHALRHTFVSRLLARGVPEWEVQRLVGHSSTLMTRYYASADMRRLREAVARL